MTEKTKTNGWVLIDAACALCRREAGRFRGDLRALGYRLAPLAPAVERGLVPDAEAMWLLPRRGRARRGADAIATLLRAHPATWALGCLLALPGVRALARRGYAWIARNRHRLGCGVGA